MRDSLRLPKFQQVFYFGFQYIYYMWHSKGGESVKIIGQIYEQTVLSVLRAEK